MKTPLEILKAELGEKRLKRLDDDACLVLVQWAMIKYAEQELKRAAEVVQEPYLKSGLTNTANRAKQAVLNLMKRHD